MSELTVQQIDELELAMSMILGDNPMPYFERLCAAARLGARLKEACEVALACCGSSEHWNGETQRFLQLMEQAMRNPVQL